MVFGPIGTVGFATGSPLLGLVDQAVRANSASYDNACPGGPLYHREDRMKNYSSSENGEVKKEKMFRLTCKNGTVDITEEEARYILAYFMKLFVLGEKKDE